MLASRSRPPLHQVLTSTPSRSAVQQLVIEWTPPGALLLVLPALSEGSATLPSDLPGVGGLWT